MAKIPSSYGAAPYAKVYGKKPKGRRRRAAAALRKGKGKALPYGYQSKPMPL